MCLALPVLLCDPLGHRWAWQVERGGSVQSRRFGRQREWTLRSGDPEEEPGPGAGAVNPHPGILNC